MNYYEVLGVSETASDKEIKKSYKQLVKRFHPDVFDGDKKLAEKKIKELNEAYEVLSNSESRKEYDESLHNAEIENIKSDLQNYAQTSQSEYSPENVSRRYENLYRNNYYKKYTTNYYGVSRDDLKQERASIRNNKTSNGKDLFGGSKSKLLIIVAISFLFLAIVLIILLSLLKELVRKNTVVSPQTIPSNQYQKEYLPYVTLDMDFYDIRDMIGSPDFVETKKNSSYAYWGGSYIVFDNKDRVIDWKNAGDYFRTDTATGKEMRVLQELYNSIIEENSDFSDF